VPRWLVVTAAVWLVLAIALFLAIRLML